MGNSGCRRVAHVEHAIGLVEICRESDAITLPQFSGNFIKKERDAAVASHFFVPDMQIREDLSLRAEIRGLGSDVAWIDGYPNFAVDRLTIDCTAQGEQG